MYVAGFQPNGGQTRKKAIAHFKAQRGYKMSDHAGSKKKKGIKQMWKTMMMEMENER